MADSCEMHKNLQKNLKKFKKTLDIPPPILVY